MVGCGAKGWNGAGSEPPAHLPASVERNLGSLLCQGGQKRGRRFLCFGMSLHWMRGRDRGERISSGWLSRASQCAFMPLYPLHGDWRSGSTSYDICTVLGSCRLQSRLRAQRSFKKIGALAKGAVLWRRAPQTPCESPCKTSRGGGCWRPQEGQRGCQHPWSKEEACCRRPRRRERKAGEETEGTTWPARRGSWSREEPGGRIRLGREWGRWVGRRLFRLRTHRTAGDRVHAGRGCEASPAREGPIQKPAGSSPLRGHKRHHYERLERSISPEGPRCRGRASQGQEEKEEEEHQLQSPESAEGSDPQQDWNREEACERKGSVRKEEEEKEKAGRWSDSEFIEQLRRRLRLKRKGGACGQLGRGYGGAHAAKVTRQSWERAVDADGARAVPDGPGFSDRGEQEPKAHRRSEGNFLLQPPHPSKLWEPSERTARDVHPGHDDRSPEKGGARASGRQSLSPVHGLAPVADRPIVGDGKAHGIIPSGGVDGRVLCLGSGVEETSAVGRQGAGKIGLDFMATKGQGKSSPRLEPVEREQPQGEERKGQSEQGQRQRKRKLEPGPRQRGNRLGEEQGESRRSEVSSSVGAPLACAVRDDALKAGWPVTWADILVSCSSIGQAGCAMAWLLVNAQGLSGIQGNSRFAESIFAIDAWHRVRRRRQALPVSEGGFVDLREVMEAATLEEVRAAAFVLRWSDRSWQLLACFACNCLAGCQRPFAQGRWTKVEQKLVDAIGLSTKRLMSHGQVSNHDFVALEKELKSRRVGYTGEEIGTCHRLTMKQVLPSLPPAEHGGSIDILNFVSKSTQFFLRNPLKMVMKDEGQDLPKLQGKIHVEEGSKMMLAKELVSRNVCRWIPFSKVFRYRGQAVLNGLFGVEKPTLLPSGEPVLRLIMNLVPSNSVLKTFEGSVSSLPQITS